jgi:hypothetical protein
MHENIKKKIGGEERGIAKIEKRKKSCSLGGMERCTKDFLIVTNHND